ncbi:hypothetical protein Pla175_24780 [Pirellulimonas nuda]|uniref:PEP-CTERM protein-sorting domain-containing protein n=1 Tax=Pirellulimonas nuda TaxID=2528009 RepID=A0A518DC77_9BACT|nr:hypothetical protein [Pirellulimonas nuda]QDU89092.1 hypothetical protein Pla175_24780 [Pirellulimonas nuda]
MKRNLLLLAMLALLAPLPVSAQVAFSDDFGDYFPGPGAPTWQWYSGGGVGGGTNPFDPALMQEIVEDGLEDPSMLGTTSQAWKVSFDATNSTDYYFWYTGGGVGSFGPEFRGAGITEEQGATDPGNWVVSLDVRAVGALGDLALVGGFEYFDPDYEVMFGVDANNDGDMEDGATTYKIGLSFYDSDGDPNGFTSNSIRLDAGIATTDVSGDIPRFNNDGQWSMSLNGGGGEYTFGDNSVTIDNLVIQFLEKPSAPGDYNEDGTVDAADYTVWRDNLGTLITLPNEGVGVTPGEVTSDDYEFWKTQFGGAPGPVVVATGVPEPGSFAVALLALAALSSTRLAGQSRLRN